MIYTYRLIFISILEYVKHYKESKLKNIANSFVLMMILWLKNDRSNTLLLINNKEHCLIMHYP